MDKFPVQLDGEIKRRPWPVYVATASCILVLIRLATYGVWPLHGTIPFSYIIVTLFISLSRTLC
jgi:hypothetical protein